MSEFAPGDECMRAGFERVMSGVAVPPDIKQSLFSDFSAAMRAGDPRKWEAAFHTHLESLDWGWSWFDEWRDRFAAGGQWPYMWRRFAAAYKDGDQEDQEKQRRMLLSHSVAKSAHSVRDVAQAQRTVERQPARWRWRLSIMRDDLITEFVPTAAADPDNPPPFFPGDRTVLMAEYISRNRLDPGAGGA